MKWGDAQDQLKKAQTTEMFVDAHAELSLLKT
jgi:hypothetical protein